MASKPSAQQGGTQSPAQQQQQGGSSSPSQQQGQQPIIRDWASI